MPRYHFQVEDSGSATDPETVNLPDIASARQEATKLAGHVLLDGAAKFWRSQPWVVRVTDDEGEVVFDLRLSATNASATYPYQKWDG